MVTKMDPFYVESKNVKTKIKKKQRFQTSKRICIQFGFHIWNDIFRPLFLCKVINNCIFQFHRVDWLYFSILSALKLLTKLHGLSVWVISPNHLRNQIGTYPMNPEFKMFSLIVDNCNYFYLMHWKSNMGSCVFCVCLRCFLCKNPKIINPSRRLDF
jgi:hypothetical protein